MNILINEYNENSKFLSFSNFLKVANELNIKPYDVFFKIIFQIIKNINIDPIKGIPKDLITKYYNKQKNTDIDLSSIVTKLQFIQYEVNEITNLLSKIMKNNDN